MLPLNSGEEMNRLNKGNIYILRTALGIRVKGKAQQRFAMAEAWRQAVSPTPLDASLLTRSKALLATSAGTLEGESRDVSST